MENVKLLKKFYSVFQISEMLNIAEQSLRTRMTIMEITPDIQISGINHYSEYSKNRIIGVYEFEKTNQQIIYFERNMKPEKFEILESKINSQNEK